MGPSGMAWSSNLRICRKVKVHCLLLFTILTNTSYNPKTITLTVFKWCKSYIIEDGDSTRPLSSEVGRGRGPVGDKQ